MMWLNIQIFGFQGLWSPWVILLTIGLGVLYYIVVGPMRHRFTDADKPSRKQQSIFYATLIIFYIIKGSPVDLLAHIMLTAHMIQTALFYFLLPILTIKGIPVWIWEKLFKMPVLRSVRVLFKRPLISTILFSAMLSLYHIPVVFDFAMSALWAHNVAHIILFAAAFIMWWPIISPIPEYKTGHPLLGIALLALSSTIITVACALIIFSSTPFYEAYSAGGAWIQSMSLCVPSDVLAGLEPTLSGPEMFSPLSALHDQQLGGALMKIVQEIVNGIMIGRILYSWFSKKSMQIDPLPTGEPVK